MVVLICGVLAVFAFMLLMKVLWTKTKPKLSTNVILITSLVFIGSLGLLAASGRVHWIAATGTAILPFLRRALGLLRLAPLASGLWRQFGGNSPFTQAFAGYGNTNEQTHDAPNQSETATDEISMSLDHKTGELSGSVLTGQFATRELSSLNEQEIVALYHEVGDDSKRLLSAFIQRYHPNLGTAQADEERSEQPTASDTITPDRARKILGVGDSATREEITEAHRRLMQKNHPDRGGSEYIASEINQAKNVLLNLL